MFRRNKGHPTKREMREIKEALRKISGNPTYFRDSSTEKKNDKGFVLSAIYANEDVLEYVFPYLLENRDIAIAAVKRHAGGLTYLPRHFKSDREVVMTAVSYHGWALQYAADELRGDKDVILAAINPSPVDPYGSSEGEPIRFATEEIRQDRIFMLNLVVQVKNILQYFPEEFRDDYEIAEYAVCFDDRNLQYCSKRLQNDKELVLKALNNKQLSNRIPLWTLTKEMQSDKEVVIAAVSHEGEQLFNASDEFRADRDDEFRADRDVVTAAIRQTKSHVAPGYCYKAFSYASDELKKDPELISLDKRLCEEHDEKNREQLDRILRNPS